MRGRLDCCERRDFRWIETSARKDARFGSRSDGGATDAGRHVFALGFYVGTVVRRADAHVRDDIDRWRYGGPADAKAASRHLVGYVDQRLGELVVDHRNCVDDCSGAGGPMASPSICHSHVGHGVGEHSEWHLVGIKLSGGYAAQPARSH